MEKFYCVGFGDLEYTWNRFGHVACHEIYLNKADAEKANEGKVTFVHEFSVRNKAALDRVIECNKKQRENMLRSCA